MASKKKNVTGSEPEVAPGAVGEVTEGMDDSSDADILGNIALQ
ncbi:hypothetical protein OHS33_38360 (plasmid) [Streptomyces sp. NBC_00536]|nr:hypothetical protein [Streptomyces sp. NBC_00536]WUC84266.1 hypothetical protein OHS33_38360 [Streptomyces sp. NBC_00536]